MTVLWVGGKIVANCVWVLFHIKLSGSKRANYIMSGIVVGTIMFYPLWNTLYYHLMNGLVS